MKALHIWYYYVDNDEIVEFLYFLKCDLFTAYKKVLILSFTCEDINARAKCSFAANLTVYTCKIVVFMLI